MIRTKENVKVGIRANFARFEEVKPPRVVFDKISEFGLQKLVIGTPVKIEVIGMPSKVTFVTTVAEKTADAIICHQPTSLVTIERRQNARFAVTTSAMAYLSFSAWSPADDDPASPPLFASYRHLAGWVPILDISAAGACIRSHFPSFINVLETVQLDPGAKLHLPMSSPMDIQAAIRWKRRIKNRIIEGNDERYQMDFRVGIEFMNLSEECQIKIRHYMRQLSVADAI